MPLHISKTVFDNATLGAWSIEEEEDYFHYELVINKEEDELLAKMKGRRKLEWLSSRYLIHLMTQRKERAIILKDDYGKPYIHDSEHFISFSHSHGIAVAIASEKPVGIDVQFIVPKITRIQHKFVNEKELTFINNLPNSKRLDALHIIWGAKESLYKAYGKRSLDFKGHMNTSPFSWDEDFTEFHGEITKGDYSAQFNIMAEKINNHILVYAEEL